MIYAIVGPTCSGKSRLAFEIAKKIHGEIINCDVFQMYKELNIGTAKPGKKERDAIRHHLFDILSPDQYCSVADYQKLVRPIIDDLLSRNIPVIIVGGGGLYLRAALYDYEFHEQKIVDLSRFQNMSNNELYDYLKTIDFDESKKLHPNNRQRVMRAISIYMQEGISKSELLATQRHVLLYKVRFYAISLPREGLYRRIDDRVEKMFADGLLSEAESLYKKYGENIPAFRAIGYKESIGYLNGLTDVNGAKEAIKKHTRNYAKTQMTFYRHQFPTLQWIREIKDVIFDE
ncbi:MAG: tRNA (adenosine(37)-N6)-dimethylallyltransferase MiaA [Bacilli bacterium]|jgi:tRNA dimethylallyltransferase